MSGFLDAAAFLTRVPVGRRPDGPPPSAAVRWFSVVGALVGLASAVVYWAGDWLAGASVGAAVAVAAQVLVTGAFHEDGLADTADAAGGWSRDERFRILDDPRHGTYGVLALVLAVVVRVAAVAALTTDEAWVALPAVHALSRGAAVVLMGLVPPASEEGLGAASVRSLANADVVAGAALGAVFGTVLLGVWVLPVLAAIAVVAGAMAAYARRTLGGIAGDLLGATQQLTDLAALVLLVGAVHHGASLPWW
ncbi:MAG: adenosylcobinamide-GDP ribazoletransferase [Actinomycetota bacterium]